MTEGEKRWHVAGPVPSLRGHVVTWLRSNPFGLELFGPWAPAQTQPANPYRYNGKELNTDLGLDWYDYGARWYDPVVGRFTGVDPVADEFNYVSVYNYAENEPIGNIDLWGLQKFKVTARAFIPQKTIPNPNPFSKIKSFAGDNRRRYEANASSFRVEQSVLLDFDNSNSKTLSNIAMPSIGFDKEGNVVGISTPGLGGTLNFSISDGVGKVDFNIDAGNKLSEEETLGLTPNINMSASVSLTPTDDGGFYFTYDISVDGFPAYEIFVEDEKGNSYLIFGRNPIESGETPWSLFPPEEHKFKKEGNSAEVPKGPIISFEKP